MVQAEKQLIKFDECLEAAGEIDEGQTMDINL
jgi:hypothetical protein